MQWLSAIVGRQGVAVELLRCSEWFLVCCYAVARVLWVAKCNFKCIRSQINSTCAEDLFRCIRHVCLPAMGGCQGVAMQLLRRSEWF